MKPIFMGFLFLALTLFFAQPGFTQTSEIRLQTNQNIKTANEAFRSGDLEKAQKHYQRALDKDNLTVDDEVNANNGLCATFMYLEQYELAIEKCEISLRLKPNSWQTLNNIGISYLGLEDFEKSIYYLQKGLDLKSDSRVLEMNLQIAEQRLQEKKIRAEIENEKTPVVEDGGDHLKGLSNFLNFYSR